jgi:hypothetical protein
MMQAPTSLPLRPRPTSNTEGPTMIDRERLLARDHEARLHAEARTRRLAAEAAAPTTADHRSVISRARLSLGHRLIGTGRRLDAGSEPCAPAEARPA